MRRLTLVLCVVTLLIIGYSRKASIMNPKATPTLIFDFDGTIADSIDEMFVSIDFFADKYGYQKEKVPTALRKQEAPVFFSEQGLNKDQLAALIRDVISDTNAKIEAIAPIEGIREVLQALRQRGIRLGIVTSNSSDNVNKFIAKHNFNYFDFVYGESGLDKSSSLDHCIIECKLDRTSSFYIGDETRDIEAAAKNNLKAVAVSWGLHSTDFLKHKQPDYLLQHPAELLKLIA